jgi:hypothetical protein
MRAEARMTPTKLLIGQIIVVLVIVLLGIWIATQWAAAALAYQPELGRPWFVAFGRPIFLPWSLFVWWFSFDAYAPKVFDEAGAIAAGSGLVGCAAAIFGSLWRARQRNNLTTYGSARWADAHDIRKAGLLTESGVFLGRTGPRYLRHDGPEHIMAFAPTRSGKGVGLVVPTLLGWSGSAVIHDIKGENWQLTAGWRQRFSHCLLFNPTDARSARYNPLLEVRRGTDEVRDVQNIADILVDPVITTDRRSYHIQLTATSPTAMAALSWTYPADQLIALRRSAEQAAAAAPISEGLSVDSLHFNYAISGDQAAWRPLRAFDDGRQTFVEFPASLAAGEAPPFFIIGPTGEAELANYRVRGRFYVIDRIFDAAELRLGTRKQQVVRINRVADGGASRKGKRS